MALRTLQEEFAKMGLLTEADIENDTLGTQDVDDVDEYEDDDEYEEDDDFDVVDFLNGLDEEELAEAKRFLAGTTKMVREKTEAEKKKLYGTKAERRRAYKEFKRSAAGKKAKRKAGKKMRLKRKKASYKKLMQKRAKRKAASFDHTADGNDRLDVLMGELHSLTDSLRHDEPDDRGDELTIEERLVNIYGNIAVICDAVGTRLHEDDELGEELDGLAEHAVQVAEGITLGDIDPEVAAAEVDGYVKDLIEGIGQVADELDEELEDDD